MNALLILAASGLLALGGVQTCSENALLPKYEVGQCLADVKGIGRIDLTTISKVTNRTSDKYELTWLLLDDREVAENYHSARVDYVEDQKYFVPVNCGGFNR